MQIPIVQIRHIGAKEELDVVEYKMCCKTKTLDMHFLALTLGAENHPHLKWGLSSFHVHTVIFNATKKM